MPSSTNGSPNPSTPPILGRLPIPPGWTFQANVSASSKLNVFRNPDEAFRHGRDNARFMRNDCAVMECVEARQRAVELLRWHIEPESAGDPHQQEICRVLTHLLRGIPNFKKYRHALLEAIWYGRSAVQHRWGWTNQNGRRRASIVGWTPVCGDKLTFEVPEPAAEPRIGIRVSRAAISNQNDRRGAGNRIETTDAGLVYFLQPWERSCLAVHRHIVEDGAFEDPVAAGAIHGVGIRSRIYWTWFQSQETLAMLLEFLERVGLGITVYYYPAGDAKAQQHMQKVAEQQHQQNYVLVPRLGGDPMMDAYGIERVEPNATGAETLRSIVHEFFGHRIKRYILGQTLSTESDGAGLGSGGISQLHREGFAQIIRSDAIDLEETLTTELVEPLVRFNYPAAAEHTFRFRIDTESPDVRDQLSALETVYKMGLALKTDDLYSLLGTAAPTDDDQVITLAQQAPQSVRGG